nr:KpsF/GutQ family sugar-phosphate isomerase [uncultured Holophaga sp.]
MSTKAQVPDDLPSTHTAAFQVLQAASSALELLRGSLDFAQLESWTRHILAGQGRVVLSGVGKSGLIARKISATLASTGCPSLFIHPGDALHGDLGMITPQDTVLLLSNSGETEEVLRLIPSLLRLGVDFGAITSKPGSHLAQAARWCFTYQLPEGEGCPLDFAPMASTTLQLVWGDILAAHRMVASGFTLERFAEFHPGGSLGARLLKCSDLMHTDAPRVKEEDSLIHVLESMTSGKLGMTLVTREDQLAGVVSDGDIRRALERAERSGMNPLGLRASDLMTRHPVTGSPDMLAIEASRIFEARKITFLVIGEPGAFPAGVLHVHDLLGAKVI